MTEVDPASTIDAQTKLAQSREELRRLLEPQRKDSLQSESQPAGASSEFPRSRTLKMLMGNRGLGALGALVGGLLIARPAVALRMLRMLPVRSIAQLLITRLFVTRRTPKDRP